MGGLGKTMKDLRLLHIATEYFQKRYSLSQFAERDKRRYKERVALASCYEECRLTGLRAV
jgi:hypothetical protein